MTELETSVRQFGKLIERATKIVVLQPEHPDADSLCSALALEQILGDAGKTIILYGQDPAPSYLSYFEGADRITDEFPDNYDLAVLVDTGGPSQINRTLEKYQGRLAARPFAILDHHTVREPLPFGAHEVIDPSFAATGQLIERIATVLKWKVSATAASLLVPAIMADTLGLTTTGTTAETVAAVARLVAQGANLHNINEARLAASALTPELLRLRAKLLLDAEWLLDDRLVVLTIDAATLKEYSKAYDPAALVFYDLQHVAGVQLVAAIKDYGAKVKLSMRSNAPIAGPIAMELGGGGHPHAAAAGLEAGSARHCRQRVIELAGKLLDSGGADETL